MDAAVFAGKTLQWRLKRVPGAAWPDPKDRVHALTCRHELLNLKLSSSSNPRTLRSGTRIRCEIPFTLSGLDPAHPFSEPSLTLLVNPQGCAARFHRPLEIGDPVRLEGLPAGISVTARVVNCIAIDKFWLLGLALDISANVWGIQSPPEDWTW